MMITALLIIIGLSMIAGGFYSMFKNDDVNNRFCIEVAVAFSGIAVIGAGILKWLIF